MSDVSKLSDDGSIVVDNPTERQMALAGEVHKLTLDNAALRADFAALKSRLAAAEAVGGEQVAELRTLAGEMYERGIHARCCGERMDCQLADGVLSLLDRLGLAEARLAALNSCNKTHGRPSWNDGNRRWEVFIGSDCICALTLPLLADAIIAAQEGKQ